MCCLVVEEVVATKHGAGGKGGLAEVAGHIVGGRRAFEERWVQKRGSYMSELCASFSEHR